MIDEDDDLPVLTQVLRTSGAHPPLPASSIDVEPLTILPVHAIPDEPAVDARVEPVLSHPLVIGVDSENGHGLDGDAAGERFAAFPPDPVADPRRLGRPYEDPFSATVPLGAPAGERLDEPPLLAGPSDRTPSSPDPFAPIGNIAREAAMAAELRAAVLADLRARIDTELDARIAQTLHAGLETALGRLQAQLREELGAALRDVVARAVDDAIARRGYGENATRH